MSITQPTVPVTSPLFVEGHAADPGVPMDRPVGPHDPVLHPVGRRARHRVDRRSPRPGRGRRGGATTTNISKLPSKPPDGNPNNASSLSSHTISPVARSHRHVPSPPTSTAACSCSDRSRDRCSARCSAAASSSGLLIVVALLSRLAPLEQPVDLVCLGVAPLAHPVLEAWQQHDRDRIRRRRSNGPHHDLRVERDERRSCAGIGAVTISTGSP